MRSLGLLFLYNSLFVLLAGCASAPEQTGQWVGRAMPVILQDKRGVAFKSLSFRAAEGERGNSVTDPLLIAALERDRHAPVLVHRNGQCLASSELPTNCLIWINGDLGVRQRVKDPSGQAAFFEQWKIVQPSLTVKSWGIGAPH